MTRQFTFLIGLLFALQTTFAQHKITYDRSKVTSEAELNFAYSENRGIKSKKGIIYYVEKNKKTITAYKNEKIKWQVNLIEICKDAITDNPEIRYIKLENDSLKIVFDKHSFASVDISNGKTTCLGSD